MVHRNKPDNEHARSLMIARKKEKQRKLTQARKPQSPAEWVALIDHMSLWFKENQWSLDIDDYAVAHGYVPYKITKDWPNEIEIFKEHISLMYALLKQRHNNLMLAEGKMSQLIMKERVLYNQRLAEYEQELKKDDEQKPTAINIYQQPIPRTNALDEHERKKHEKNTLE